jgi:hypothetical protein
MQIILRGGPFTGQVHDMDAAQSNFRARAGTRLSAMYETTGHCDRGTGLPIFIYCMPPPDVGMAMGGGIHGPPLRNPENPRNPAA